MDARAAVSRFAALIVGATGIVAFNRDGSNVNERSWMTVVRDSSYTVSIDTTRITRKFGRAYVAWYRTDHATTHAMKGAAFNREVVQAILLCDNIVTFKIASVNLSLGNAKPVSQQRTSSGELYHQQWRGVQSGTSEEAVAKATCGMMRGK